MSTPRIIIVGASSGIGNRLATIFAQHGWRVGVAARREAPLVALQTQYDNIEYITLDVTAGDAVARLQQLIDKVGGMDVLMYCAGCGWNNPNLDNEKDITTINTNVLGFTQIVNAGYKYFLRRHQDDSNSTTRRPQIAVITSIAGTKGIGVASTYSSSKRYQTTYLQSLDQLAHNDHLPLTITELRPGFVDTPLLDGDTHKYPMMMTVDYVASRIFKVVTHRRHIVTINRRWAVITALWRLIPSWLWRHIKLNN